MAGAVLALSFNVRPRVASPSPVASTSPEKFLQVCLGLRGVCSKKRPDLSQPPTESKSTSLPVTCSKWNSCPPAAHLKVDTAMRLEHKDP